MTNLVDLEAVPPFDVWGEAVRARKIEGERLTLAVVELAPEALVPEHRHESEQLGICIEGSITFTIDGETRELGPRRNVANPVEPPAHRPRGSARRHRDRRVRAHPIGLGFRNPRTPNARLAEAVVGSPILRP